MFVAQITFQNPNLNLVDTAIAVIVSLAASIIVYLMYHLFYGSRTIGAGVDSVACRRLAHQANSVRRRWRPRNLRHPTTQVLHA